MCIGPRCGRCGGPLDSDDVEIGLAEERHRKLHSEAWRCGKCRLVEQYKPLHLLDDETFAKMSAIHDDEMWRSWAEASAKEPGIHQVNPINQRKRREE